MRLTSVALGLCLIPVGCSDDDGDTGGGSGSSSTTAPTTTMAPTTTATTTATSATTGTTTDASTGGTGDTGGGQAVQIDFAAMVGAEPAACGTDYMNFGTSGATVQLRDIRFYVSNVRLVDGGGAEVEVMLDQDMTWQHMNLALLDFEDGTGDCMMGTAETNTSIRGTVPVGTYTGLRFDLGIPFDLNHLDVATAPSPLNIMGLFWNWNFGYKFVRIDVTNENMAPDNVWNFHLGSTGCSGATMQDPPAQECDNPNRPAIEITPFDVDADTVLVDVGALFATVDVNADTAMTTPGCMSFPPDVTECTPIYPNVGLDYATGDCINGCADQTVFAAG